MPSASRNANRKRRVRRNITLLKRAGQSEAIARAKTTVILFAVLNKLGGELEISQVDLSTAAQNLSKLSFAIEPSAVEGKFMVKLVALTEEQPAEPTVDAAIQAANVPQETEDRLNALRETPQPIVEGANTPVAGA